MGVLIASALMVTIGLGASLRGIDAARSSIDEESSLLARFAADACAEEALMKLKSDLNYTGNELILMGGGSACTITSVSGSGNTDRLVRTQANVGGFVKKIIVDVARVNPLLTVRSWREDGN